MRSCWGIGTGGRDGGSRQGVETGGRDRGSDDEVRPGDGLPFVGGNQQHKAFFLFGIRQKPAAQSTGLPFIHMWR